MLLWHALLFGVLSLVTGTSPDIGVALAALMPAAQEHGLGCLARSVRMLLNLGKLSTGPSALSSEAAPKQRSNSPR